MLLHSAITHLDGTFFSGIQLDRDKEPNYVVNTHKHVRYVANAEVIILVVTLRGHMTALRPRLFF